MKRYFLSPIFSVVLLVCLAGQAQADLAYRNSLGIATTAGAWDLSLSSIQTADEFGASLGSYSLSFGANRSIGSGHRLLMDGARYNNRAGESWTTFSRYRLGWSYRWQPDDIAWTATTRLEHRDVSGDQHQRLELSLQAGKRYVAWSPYLSAQLRYHLTDQYMLLRRANLGTGFQLNEQWNLGIAIRYQQSKRAGEWADPEPVVSTSIEFEF